MSKRKERNYATKEQDDRIAKAVKLTVDKCHLCKDSESELVLVKNCFRYYKSVHMCEKCITKFSKFTFYHTSNSAPLVVGSVAMNLSGNYRTVFEYMKEFSETMEKALPGVNQGEWLEKIQKEDTEALEKFDKFIKTTCCDCSFCKAKDGHLNFFWNTHEDKHLARQWQPIFSVERYERDFNVKFDPSVHLIHDPDVVLIYQSIKNFFLHLIDHRNQLNATKQSVSFENAQKILLLWEFLQKEISKF